jgi:hypothetical protein
VRLINDAADLLPAERVEQADALRRGEDEIEPATGASFLRLDEWSSVSGLIRSIVITRTLRCR